MIDNFIFLFFLFGGFILNLIISLIIIAPLIKNIYHKQRLLFISVPSLIIIIWQSIFDLTLHGRNIRTLMPIACYIIPIIFFFLYFIKCLSLTNKVIKIKSVTLAIILFLLNLWCLFISWIVTHSCFMGACC